MLPIAEGFLGSPLGEAIGFFGVVKAVALIARGDGDARAVLELAAADQGAGDVAEEAHRGPDERVAEIAVDLPPRSTIDVLGSIVQGEVDRHLESGGSLPARDVGGELPDRRE